MAIKYIPDGRTWHMYTLLYFMPLTSCMKMGSCTSEYRSVEIPHSLKLRKILLCLIKVVSVFLGGYKNFQGGGYSPVRLSLTGDNWSTIGLRPIGNVTTYCLFHRICRYIQTHRGTCIHVFFYPWHMLPHVYTGYRSPLQWSSTSNFSLPSNSATHRNEQSVLNMYLINYN